MSDTPEREPSAEAFVPRWLRRLPAPPSAPTADRTTRLLRSLPAVQALEHPLASPPLPASPPAAPGERDERLAELEPQFILRNLLRLERDAEDELPFEIRPHTHPMSERGGSPLRRDPYRPPELPALRGERVMAEARRATRRWFHDADWRRYFGRELRERIEGPVWRYDPDVD